jgi:hypothetical protein
MSRFTNIYDVLTADTTGLTLGEASFWLSTAQKTVAKIPASSRSIKHTNLLDQLKQMHKDLDAEVQIKLSEQADEDDQLVRWASVGGDYTDDLIGSGDENTSAPSKKGRTWNVLGSVTKRLAEFKAGETEEEARTNATWESVVNAEIVSKALSDRMEDCKESLQSAVAAAASLVDAR